MNRPEPYSSPSSAKAPLVSPPDGASDHHAFTKGVGTTSRVNVGKDSGRGVKGKKKVKKQTTRKVGR